MVSRIAFVLVSITSTVSDWSSTTYRSVCAAFSVILLGWPFTGSRAVTDGAQSAKDVDPGDHPPRFTTSISRSRMLDTYAVASKPLPFTTTQNGSSPPGPPRHPRQSQIVARRPPAHRHVHLAAPPGAQDRLVNAGTFTRSRRQKARRLGHHRTGLR